MSAVNTEKPLSCSFCGKNEQQVLKLIKGPGVNICEDCVMACVLVLHDEGLIKFESDPPEAPAVHNAARPKECSP